MRLLDREDVAPCTDPLAAPKPVESERDLSRSSESIDRNDVRKHRNRESQGARPAAGGQRPGISLAPETRRALRGDR